MTKSALLTRSSVLAITVAALMVASPAFDFSQVSSDLLGVSEAQAARVKAVGRGGGGHVPRQNVRSNSTKRINNGIHQGNAGGNAIGNNTHIGGNTINNNNVNINKNVNVNVDNHNGWDNDWDDHWHPVATAAAVTATAVVTAAVVGSIVNSIPPSCGNVMIGNMLYYQCGSSWYQPQYVGTNVTYIVVPPPR